MNNATLSFSNGKWTATYGGKILASSPNKEYITNNIRNGRCTKANMVNVTDVIEIGETAINTKTGQVEKIERFTITERFNFLEDFTGMVADRTSASLLVTGEGGLGKTFTIMKSLKRLGFKNVNDLIGFSSGDNIPPELSKTLYTVVKGFSTAKGLYRTLFENRNGLVIFDDCDSVLKDPVAVNLLKGALDSYDKRTITWNAESSFGGEDDLPKSFEFKGGVIFISNMNILKIDQAIRTRAITVDLSMTTAQKIERMSTIIRSEEFLPSYEMTTKENALAFLESMQHEAKEISFRTLIAVTKVAGRGNDWERRAEYLLTAV